MKKKPGKVFLEGVVVIRAIHQYSSCPPSIAFPCPLKVKAWPRDLLWPMTYEQKYCVTSGQKSLRVRAQFAPFPTYATELNSRW